MNNRSSLRPVITGLFESTRHMVPIHVTCTSDLDYYFHLLSIREYIVGNTQCVEVCLAGPHLTPREYDLIFAENKMQDKRLSEFFADSSAWFSQSNENASMQLNQYNDFMYEANSHRYQKIEAHSQKSLLRSSTVQECEYWCSLQFISCKPFIQYVSPDINNLTI